MAVTEVVLIRHGETVWNREQRFQGQNDSALSALGLQQAAALERRFAGERFDVLYSSDLVRAMQTARAIADACQCAIIAEAGLRERHFGVFQGLTWEEILARHPEAAAGYESGDPSHVVPGGESLRQRAERHIAAMNRIAAAHAGQRAVVVAHGGVLDSLLRYAMSIPLDRPRTWKLYNASVNVFICDGGRWMLGRWGDTHHLAELDTDDDY